MKIYYMDNPKTTEWSGGTTTEFLISPRGSDYACRDFLWRVSSAVVRDPESDFTALPDYMRFITPLSGSLDLLYDERQSVSLQPYDVFYFDGGKSLHSQGVCRDFNLMLRKDAAVGSLECLQLSSGAVPIPIALLPRAEDVLLFCARGEVSLNVADGRAIYTMVQDQILVLEHPADLSVTASSASPSEGSVPTYLVVAQARRTSQE